MALPQTVVVPVDMNEENLDALKAIHRMSFLREAEFHFVYAIQDIIYNEDIINYGYLMEQRPEIEVEVTKKMKELSVVVLPEGHAGKVHYHCLFGNGTKETVTEFISNLKPRLTIVATKERHGFFQSSFAFYLGQHASSDVLIVRSLLFNHAVFKGKMKATVGLKFKTTDLLLPSLKKYEFLQHAHIQLLHVSPITDYNFLPEIRLPLYSSDEARSIIKQVITARLKELKKEILPEGFEGICEVDCCFGPRVARRFCELAQEAQTDLLVLRPDRKHSLGGFIHHQIQHSRANILLVKS